MELADRITRLVAGVERNRESVGVLSTGEAIAVAMVLNDEELLPDGYGTWVEAAGRLGEEWLRAAITVQRSRPRIA